MYDISINRSNAIGSQETEDSVDTRRGIVEDDGLDNKDELLSVTVIVNGACEDGEYPVTVMFGTVPRTSSGGCNIQRNVSGQVPLRPGQPPTTFPVETSSITLGPDEEYCYIVFLRGVPVITVRGGGSGLSVGAIVGIAVLGIFIVAIIIIIVIVVVFRKRNKARGPERDQNPATIKRTAHPETGEMYTMVDLKKRNREPEQAGATALYQDPSTIQHQEGPSGELYAMPQKTGKKKKKEEAEAEAEVEEMSEEQKAALYSVPDRKGQKSKSEGLEYAQLDIQPSVKQAPPSKGSNYVDIRY